MLSLLYFPYFFGSFSPVKATMTSKGQITIPIKLRNKLGLKTGTVLEFDENAPHLSAKRALEWSSFDEFGKDTKDSFPELTVPELLDELRGPVQLPKKTGDENRD